MHVGSMSGLPWDYKSPRIQELHWSLRCRTSQVPKYPIDTGRSRSCETSVCRPIRSRTAFSLAPSCLDGKPTPLRIGTGKLRLAWITYRGRSYLIPVITVREAKVPGDGISSSPGVARYKPSLYNTAIDTATCRYLSHVVILADPEVRNRCHFSRDLVLGAPGCDWTGYAECLPSIPSSLHTM
jgi:hypothetical protein